jgi:hypothetical protein
MAGTAGGDAYVAPEGFFLADGSPLVTVDFAKNDGRAQVRPAIEIALLLEAAYGECADAAPLLKGLEAVARALDAGDLARAAIAAVHLGLPPMTDPAAPQRLVEADRLLKGSFDPNEPRDQRGRWTTGSAAPVIQLSSTTPSSSFLDHFSFIGTARAAGAEEDETRSPLEELRDPNAAARLADFAAACAKLRAIEPGNLQLQSIETLNHVPTQEEIDTVNNAYREALGRIGAETTSPYARENPFTEYYVSGSGGRWGGNSTRTLNEEIASWLKGLGFNVTKGGGERSEEWIPGPTGTPKGGNYVDITAEKGTTVVRIQTITTLADGKTPIPSEAAAAARIRAEHPDDVLILIPKR